MVTKINKISRRAFLMILFFIAAFGYKAQASHYAAVDLYMDYIGTGPTDLKYQVTLVVYKACEWGPNATAIDLSAQESVSFASSCGSRPSRTITGSLPDTLDQLCPQFAPINTCRQYNSPWPAFVRKVYTDTVTLPFACTDWRIYWSSGSRNAGIVNLVGPSGLNIYVEAGINNVAKWNNSSPRFLIDPIPYLCQNQPAFFLNGPLDPNNDSLVTTNVQPLNSSATTPCNYATTPYAFSLSNPVASTAANPYTVNPNTGTATFTPTLQGKFVLAFECHEYDRFNGTLLGYIRRDVQVSVVNCNAAPPFIDSIPNNLIGGNWVSTPPSGGYILACPGVQLSFDITSLSQSISNTVYLSANNVQVAPGSSFFVTANGTSNPIGTFQWTPTGNDLGDYTIIFKAKDSTCTNGQPILLQNYFVAFIKVLPGVDAGPDGRICKLDGVPWQFNVTGPPSATYIWSALGGGPLLGLSDPTISNPTAYPPYNFTYIVEAPNVTSACKNRDTVQVYIDTSNAVQAIPDNAVLCRPGYMQLSAQAIGLPPLNNLECGLTDTISCTTEDVNEIRSQYSGGTVMASGTYSPFNTYRSAKFQYLLTKADLFAYGMRAGTLHGIAFETTAPTTTTYSNFTISVKCTDRTTLSAASGGMEPGALLVYTAPGPVVVTNGWNQFTFDRPYSLDSTKNLIIEICYKNTAVGTAAPVNSVTTNSQQMVVTFTNIGTASICQNPLAAAGTTYYTTRPNVRINYCPADTVPFPYTWTPGTFLSDSTAQNPLAYVPQDVKYYVNTIGRNGCKVRDSIIVHVPIHHYDVFPKDTSFCIGTSFTLSATGDFDKVKWYETSNFYTPTTLDCDDCVSPVGTPLTDTKYYAVMTDKDGCSDTMIVNAIVKPMPIVNILNNDTTLKYGQSLQLLVSGAYLYSWQPISTLSNPNIVNPYATPTEPTTYYVYGLAENGCRNIDSVHINIDYRDNLFVPSAFTPNGDGTNDIFRVANITFQKLQEFRIFNRWGQEIYSTTDPKKGWDGSWKGVPQDMGAYQYLIRVAYPDGYIETYKGNVNLIR